jgi:uncharacterized protein (TIGR02001 family)
MRKPILLLPLAAAALAAPLLALAQVTGNMTIATDYRFRGLSQTMSDGLADLNDGGPAFQGGIDYAHPSGFYIGNWNSNVSSAIYPNSNLEMDFYGGYKKAFGDFGVDVGAIYYFYPGSRATISNLQTGETCTDCRIDNTEIYVGGSWKFLSAKFFYAIDDFFGIPGTDGSWYLDLNGTFEVAKGLSVVGHVGRQEVNDFSDANYTDWKVGVTYDLAGWVLGAAYIDTNAKSSVYTFSDARKTMNIGDSTVVLSVTKTF